jgi:hypothetical protein
MAGKSTDSAVNKLSLKVSVTSTAESTGKENYKRSRTLLQKE